MKRARHAFTIWELVAVIAVLLTVIAVFLPAIAMNRRAARELKDGTQIRGIHQAMITWSGQSFGEFPSPGSLDHSDTIPGIDTSDNPRLKTRKNLPRWSLSMMVYLGFMTPEVLVSPAEVHPAIRVNTTFQMSNPTAIAPSKRSRAFLDPSFAAYPDEPGGDTPIIGGGGTAPAAGTSYSFVAFAGHRRAAWDVTFDRTQAVIANRGPWYSQDATYNWSLNRKDRRGAKRVLASESNTLLMHGSRTAWEGNVACNDGSVSFEMRPDPEYMPLFPQWFGGSQGNSRRTRYDNLFANENEDSDTAVYTSADDDITEATNTRRNNYLRCYGDRAMRRFDEKTGQLVALGGFWHD